MLRRWLMAFERRLIFTEVVYGVLVVNLELVLGPNRGG